MKDNSTNPPRYYGLCIDILEKISPILGFNYTVYEPSDGMVGVYNKELKLWSGVIGDLMYGVRELWLFCYMHPVNLNPQGER